MDVLKISLICLISVAFCLSLVIFFVLIMFHSDMRVINRKRFNNFNERRTIGVDSEVFLTFEEFMNYYSLAPGKYVGEYDNKPSLRFCCYKPEAEQNKIFPKKIQIGFKTLKDYKQHAKWVCEVETFDEKLKKQKETAEFLNYVQDDINALRKQSVDEMRIATDSMQQIITQQNAEKSLENFLNKDEKFFENEF